MLDLTKDEKQVVINALDLMVKQTGLNGASVVLPLAIKIQQSMMDDPEKPKPDGKKSKEAES